MDIIFQSGEFYGVNTHDLLSTIVNHAITLLGVLITGFIAVSLFNKSVQKERLLNQERRNQSKEDIAQKQKMELAFFKGYFLTLLTGALENTLRQKEDYLVFADKVVKNPLKAQWPMQETRENLTRILKLDTEKILRIFDQKELSYESFIKLLNRLDFIKAVLNKIEEGIFNVNDKTVIDLSNKVIEIRQNILKVSTDFIRNEKLTNKDYESSSLWLTINDLVKDYFRGNAGVPSLQWDYDKLIIPIKEKLLTDELYSYEVSIQLLDLSNTAGNLIFSIRSFNQVLAKDLKTTCISIDEVCSKIQKTKDLIT